MERRCCPGRTCVALPMSQVQMLISLQCFFTVRPLRCCWTVSFCTDVLRKELQSKKRVAMKVVPCRPRDSIGVILLPTLLLWLASSSTLQAQKCGAGGKVFDSLLFETWFEPPHLWSERDLCRIFATLMKVPQASRSHAESLDFPSCLRQAETEARLLMSWNHPHVLRSLGSKWFRPASDCVDIFGFCHWFVVAKASGPQLDRYKDTTWYNMIQHDTTWYNPKAVYNDSVFKNFYSTLLRLPWVLFRRTRRRCTSEAYHLRHSTTPKGETMDALCSAWQDCGNAYFQVVVIHTFLDGGDANRKLSLGTHGTVWNWG